MSSSNNATMPNQSREPEVDGNYFQNTHLAKCRCVFWKRVFTLFIIIAHCLCMAVLFFYGQYDLFSSNYLYYFCSVILAFIGVWKDIDHLLMPYIFTIACDMIYAIMRIVLIYSFYAIDQKFILKVYLYDYWPEKAQQLDNLESGKHYIYWRGPMMACFVLMCTFSWLANLLKIHFEHMQKLNNYQINYYFNTIHEQRQQLEQMEQESMLSQFPPPPSYQDFSDSVAVISPPQDGIPPPDYSILEEHQIDSFIEEVTAEGSETSQEDFSTTTS